jgi:hypothetical protein
MKTINKQNNLAILSEKEKEINSRVQQELSQKNSLIIQIINYTEKEKEKIDDFMQHVYRVDDLIKAWQWFANSVQYNLFVVGYNQLSPRIKIHFEEIFKEFRLKYLMEKISKNLVNYRWPKYSLTQYFAELQKDFPNFDIQYFYENFPQSSELLNQLLKKEA